MRSRTSSHSSPWWEAKSFTTIGPSELTGVATHSAVIPADRSESRDPFPPILSVRDTWVPDSLRGFRDDRRELQLLHSRLLDHRLVQVDLLHDARPGGIAARSE